MLKTPPFLIGSAILFWGWQTQILWLAVGMAVVVEASHWIKWRIDFSVPDFNRIWDLCSLLTVLAGFYCVLNRDALGEVATLFRASNFTSKNAAVQELSSVAIIFFQWWPMLLFLMLGAQAYSGREVVPYTSYSILARRSLKRQGKPQEDTPGVNFSFPYFALCLFSASLTGRTPQAFFWCFTALCLWGFWVVRPRRFSLVVWILVMSVFVGLGYFGQRELPGLANRMEAKLGGWMTDFLFGNQQGQEFDTEIGDVMEMKGSGRIVKRITAVAGPMPALLRDVVYTRFNGRKWDNDREIAFLEVDRMQGGESWLLRRTESATNELTITTTLNPHPTVLSRPSGLALLDDLPAADVTTNHLGSVRAREGPPFVVYKAIYGRDGTIDSQPEWLDEKSGLEGFETAMTEADGRAVHAVSREIGLKWGEDPKSMARKITAFFAEGFDYSLSVPSRPPPESKYRSLLAYFLLDYRKGHCEMFASATVLLMRLNGAGARYALGWSVQEEGDDGEYVVRMRHAHAWCRYWSIKDEQWYDLDTTPPSWFETEASRAPWYEPVQDWWANRMHSFRMWRYYGDTGNMQNYLYALLGILITILAWRILVRRRKRTDLSEDSDFWEFAKLGLDSEFYEIENRIKSIGLVRHDGESLLDWVNRLEGRDEVKPDLLRKIVNLHYQYRFDPKGLSEHDRKDLQEVVRQWLMPADSVTA